MTKRFGVSLALRAMVQDLAGQHMLVGRHVFGVLSLDVILSCRLDAAKQGRGDERCHFVLDGENVFEFAIVAFRPQMRFSFAVDELDGHSDAIPALRTLPSTI